MNKSKRKGTAFETEVVRFLQENGFPQAERRALRGNKDCGDIAGIPNWILECKAEKEFSLSSYMKEVEAEIENAGVDYGAAVLKRPRAGTGDAYLIVPLRTWVEHLRAVSPVVS